MTTDPRLLWIVIILGIYYLLVFLYLWLVAVRTLRWLSWWQQKEYRWDRMSLFLVSQDGRDELKKVVNLNFRRVSIRRPKFTLKVSLIFFLSLVIVLSVAKISWFLAVLGYGLIPVIIGGVVILANTLTSGIQWRYEMKARDVVSKAKPKIIGITGSYGKTTTKILITELLKSKYKVWMSPKSYNTPLSLPITVAKSYKGEEIMVLEYAAYKKGEIGRVAKLFEPNTAVITGIAPQHVGLFGSMDKIVEAKSELLEALPTGAKVFFNKSDDQVVGMVGRFDDLELIGVGSKESKYKTNLFKGLYGLNINLAVSVARDMGVGEDKVKTALGKFEPNDRFVRKTKLKSGVWYVDDGGTSNPKGFESVLDELALMTGRKMVVSAGIVDLGAESIGIHRQLAKKINQVADWFVHTTELEASIMKQVLGEKYLRVSTKEDLNEAITKLKSGDVLLLEGKLRADLQVGFNEL